MLKCCGVLNGPKHSHHEAIADENWRMPEVCQGGLFKFGACFGVEYAHSQYLQSLKPPSKINKVAMQAQCRVMSPSVAACFSESQRRRLRDHGWNVNAATAQLQIPLLLVKGWFVRQRSLSTTSLPAPTSVLAQDFNSHTEALSPS